jgi:hypothetical protein
MASKPFMRGRNARLLVQIDGVPQTIRVKRHSVDENATEGADDCNGEDRSRPFIETNFFELGFEPFAEDMALCDAWLGMLANDDAQVAPTPVTFALVFNPRNGTKRAFMGRDCTRRPFKIDAGERTGAIMLPWGFRARYFKKTQ